MAENVIDKFAPYPKTEADATAQNVYRHLLVSAQVTFLRWQRRAESPRILAELFVADWTSLVLLRTVMVLEPQHTPDEVARELWTGWEDGSGPAELLWEWLVEAGIDPEEIEVEFEKVAAPSIPSESRSNHDR